ncbi:MAG: hypothetical protein A2821_00055 [Candidatus Magasanikbacteria bacterium RIFCSPHIGHO2_01_FULL_41_23]|uniref:Nudix hydrolase domain-containing protein n=1 Tax=Candidatus Magasanikbacteria bacterium RIFCSPLOWO2_01_FULL_40_15 TaxID=1798686 RepID=A0A1F6N4C4_9BACT|nr:MAG: hypothetical protein A2821_00055 [Candidatus Magasanikbacteria bacterium RIFCSPHIGHO2_01_FULL_41_23]OGH76610.1 MAG: hypothetical protein A3F22_04715 [Candidatus Magasanikbacteria bacterium RIFCSPHIGHO2_12_FULL_41_16]OGH78588.1 MAG: hypothetical protein A2983_02915 [Candidatus Magasanikbacteria bacterium RIFCSPLOWO2_01_FULL_40_15]
MVDAQKNYFRVIPAVFLILVRNNKILLLRRTNTGHMDGHYSMIAGHLEPGETLREAMQREAKEESSVSVALDDLELSSIDHRVVDERVNYFFVARKWEGEPQNLEPKKCDDLSWFNLANLPENTIYYIREAIENYKKNKRYSDFS